MELFSEEVVDVRLGGRFVEDGLQFEELPVLGVTEVRDQRDRAFFVVLDRRKGSVDEEKLVDWSLDSFGEFDETVCFPVDVAMLAVKPHREKRPERVQKVEDPVRRFLRRGREDVEIEASGQASQDFLGRWPKEG